MNKIFDALKERWGLDSFWQVLVVLIVFAVTGMSVLYVRQFAFELLGIGEQTPFWLKTMAWLVVVLPSYQVLLLFFGFLFGQFDFVWRFEKRSVRKLMSLWK